MCLNPLVTSVLYIGRLAKFFNFNLERDPQKKKKSDPQTRRAYLKLCHEKKKESGHKWVKENESFQISLTHYCPASYI